MRRALALAALLLAGCASAPRAIDPRPLDARAGIVFFAHGIWPDGGWVAEAERACRAAGLETAPVEYTCFLPGYVLEYGTDAPAERLAALVRALEARHAATGCRAPLRYHIFGYSAGTVVALKAAALGVRFENAWLGGSPVLCFSSAFADAVAAGQIHHLVNYWSPFDGVVGLGAGELGYWRGGDDPRIESCSLAYQHAFPPFDEDLAGRLARALAVEARDAPPHTCFRDAAFLAWWRRATDRLAREEPLEPEPAPRTLARAGASAAK